MSKFVVGATWDDVPHLSPEQKAALWGSIPPYQRDARAKGIPQLGSGAIYPVPESEIVVDPFELPLHWPRGYGLDVGWNRTAAVWGAHDRDTDVVYLWSEHYRGQAEPSVHAAAIRARGEWMAGAVDPAARGRGQWDGEQLLANPSRRPSCGARSRRTSATQGRRASRSSAAGRSIRPRRRLEPHRGGWGAHDRDTDVVWLWSEHYRGQAEPSVHAAAIRARGAWMQGAVDPAARGRGQRDGEQLLANYIDLGLQLTKADNGVEAGLFDVWERLSTGRLKVFRTLQSWLGEYRLYRRDEKGAVVKKDDHLMDATRYFIVSGLPLCLVAPDAGRRLARGDDGQANHQSDYDPFEEL